MLNQKYYQLKQNKEEQSKSTSLILWIIIRYITFLQSLSLFELNCSYSEYIKGSLWRLMLQRKFIRTSIASRKPAFKFLQDRIKNFRFLGLKASVGLRYISLTISLLLFTKYISVNIWYNFVCISCMQLYIIENFL